MRKLTVSEGGASSFEIEFVTIHTPNTWSNKINYHSIGAVNREYRIGKYEISEGMVSVANAIGSLGITHDHRGENKPATSIDWYEAAKFVNFLNTSKGHPPAYKFRDGEFEPWQRGDSGFSSANAFRHTGAMYFLPSADEWHKAAFFDPEQPGAVELPGVGFNNFPTGSDLRPNPVASGTSPGTAVWDQSFLQGPADINRAGGLSPYGTMAQAGNVYEWEETARDFINFDAGEDRAYRGGSWASSNGSHLFASRRGWGPPEGGIALNQIGFRVASVFIPEPSSCVILLLGGLPLFLRRSRVRVAS